MREIERVTGVQALLDGWPDGFLGGVGNEHFDDGAALSRFLHVEQGLAGLPAVFAGPVPVSLELLRLADDDVEAVVLHVEGLGRALDAVADHGDGLFLQHPSCVGHGKLFAHDHPFLDAPEIDQSHEIFLLSVRCS